MVKAKMINLPGGLTTATVLSYIVLSSTASHLINEDLYVDLDLGKTELAIQEQDDSSYYSYPYYSYLQIQEYTLEKAHILQAFVSKLVGNTVDIEPIFSETVDKHFWDLA